MKANQLAALVLRLLGIYCLIVFVPFVSVFSGALYYARNTGNTGAVIVSLSVFFCLLWLRGRHSALIVCSAAWG